MWARRPRAGPDPRPRPDLDLTALRDSSSSVGDLSSHTHTSDFARPGPLQAPTTPSQCCGRTWPNTLSNSGRCVSFTLGDFGPDVVEARADFGFALLYSGSTCAAIGRVRAKVGRFRATFGFALAKLGPSLVDAGRTLVFGRFRAKRGQIWVPTSRQNVPNSAQCCAPSIGFGPILAGIGLPCHRLAHSSFLNAGCKLWTIVGQLQLRSSPGSQGVSFRAVWRATRRTSDYIQSVAFDLCRAAAFVTVIWPNSVKLGPCSAQIGPTLAKLGRH